MKTHLAISYALVLFFLYSASAQPENKTHVLFGLNVLTPYTRGSIDGPMVVVDTRPASTPQNSSNTFSSNTMFLLTAGLRIDEVDLALLASFGGWVEIHHPFLQGWSEYDLAIRYMLWWNSEASFCAIVSAERSTYKSDAGMFNGPYDSKTVWFPGVGFGGNFSVLHGEIQLRGWPRTIIAYAHEPNGLPPNSFGQASYDLKPVYLNYAISFALGLEFDVISF